MKLRRRHLAALFVCVSSAIPICRAEAVQPKDDETIIEYVNRACGLPKNAPMPWPDASVGLRAATKDRALRETADAEARVREDPSVESGSSGFASHVHDGLADYLSLFQSAISAVENSDDQRSLTVKFNPLSVGAYGQVSVSATAQEPVIFQPLLDAIVEDVRVEQKDALGKKTGDLSDVTWAASYAFQIEPDEADVWGNSGWIWGRNHEFYAGFIAGLLEEQFAAAADVTKKNGDGLIAYGTIVAALNSGPGTDIGAIKFGAMDPATKKKILDALQPIIDGQNATIHLVQSWSGTIGHLHNLIDNQPQLVLQGSYENRGRFVGPSLRGLTLSYEHGFRNFNSALRYYRRMKKAGKGVTIAHALDHVLNNQNVGDEDKVTFSATYKVTEGYRIDYDYVQTVTDPSTMTDTEIARTAHLDLPRNREISGKLQWSRMLRLAPKKKEDDETPRSRFLLSAEYDDVRNDPLRRDRFIARATLDYPLKGGASLPLTVTYANHSQFLGDQDRVLTAHFGISWKGGGGKNDAHE